MSSRDQLLEKWARVAERVAYKTLDNELRWEDTERDGVYQTSFPEYTIRIEKRQLREDTAQPTEIVITLHNNWGKAIGEITESEYAQTGHSTALLHEMYQAAKQKAMKLEESLDDVLKYLEK